MDKEMFEKLFDVGLPCIQHYGRYLSHDSSAWPSEGNLLVACGEEFRMLLLHTTYHHIVKKPWEAVPNKRLRPEVKGQKGKSAIEAVAKLYIALHSKVNE